MRAGQQYLNRWPLRLVPSLLRSKQMKDQEDMIYKTAAQTDILATFRRLGWTPPSEQPEVIAKWEYYKSLPLRKHDN
jgi:hypothetical protein